MKKLVICLVVALTASFGFGFFAGCKSGKVKIYVDGGSQHGQYNSTISMQYDAVANPYPYNTLETLADEWNKSNKKFEIVINKSSLNNDREKLTAQLSQGKAPDILFTLGSLAEDMNKGWYAPLNDYFERPNKYIAEGKGSQKWKDIYNEKEFRKTVAPNGKHYSVLLEIAPIGIMYNKAIFERVGITKEPETFKELMSAQKKIYDYRLANSIAELELTPYFPLWNWYDILIEGAIFANYSEGMDLDDDGVVNTEEIVRAYKRYEAGKTTGIYSMNTPQYRQYIKMVREMTTYFPPGHEGFYAEQEFALGKVGMLEANSAQIMKMYNDPNIKDNIGLFPYPVIDDESAGGHNPGGYFTRRGTAGLATGWNVTNSAVNKGQEAVDACVDFLQFITTKENNNKMVNDLGFAIPISGEVSDDSILKGLVMKYQEDLDDPKSLAWGNFNVWGSMTKEYLDAFLNTRKTLISPLGGKTLNQRLDEVIGEITTTEASGLTKAFALSVNKLISSNKEWDLNSWLVD